MNPQNRADQAFESWLDDGPTRMPEHLVDSIVAQLEETHQRKHWWLPGREQMNRMMVAVGGMAAIALVAAMGFYFLGGRGGGGFGGVATPSPTVAPTASPSPTPSASPAATPAPTSSGSPVANLPSWYTPSETPTGPGMPGPTPGLSLHVHRALRRTGPRLFKAMSGRGHRIISATSVLMVPTALANGLSAADEPHPPRLPLGTVRRRFHGSTGDDHVTSARSGGWLRGDRSRRSA